MPSGEAGEADEAIAEMKKLVGFSKSRVLTLTGYTGQAGEVKNQPELIKQAKDMGKGIAEALAAK